MSRPNAPVPGDSPPRATAKKKGGVTANKTFSLKDRLFNPITVRLLADGLKRADATFDRRAFETEVLAQFPQLELKACIDCMADALVSYLPTDYAQATQVLHRALPQPLDPTLSDDDFGQFIWAVPSEFAARKGCTGERITLSLELLRETTKRFSAEFAIRPFLRDFPEETYAFLKDCAQDKNYHVRRLASEGTRPNLPWGLAIDLPVDKTIAMLDLLHADPTRFVTRSVANNLNDISKTDPDVVLKALKRWAKLAQRQSPKNSQKNSQNGPKELDWLTKHALRGLIKADHLEALTLLGYSTQPSFKLSKVSCADVIQVGDSLEWGAKLVSGKQQKLKIALRVHFLKANGSYSSKVFSLKDTSAEKGQMLTLRKRIAFKAMTTRALYPGEHRVEVVVNGVARGKRRFVLQG